MKQKIFVSSVQKELDLERRGVKSLIEGDLFLSQHFVPVLYELLPIHGQKVDTDPLDVLDTCQIYLLIVAREYGSIVRDGKSMTHLEYEHANDRDAKGKMPVLIYLKHAKREENTKRLLQRIKRDKYKYHRFRDVVGLQEAVRESLEKLATPLPTPQERGRKSVTLGCVVRWMFASFICLVLLLSLAPSAIRYWQFERVKRTQRQTQSIEERLNQLHRVRERSEGEEVYTDTDGAWLAQDLWRGGRLDRRRLFRKGKLIAEDRFEYSGDIATGKERVYLDNANRVFLVDTFTVDGIPTGKVGYPDGLLGKRVDYRDVMRSPLPPVAPFVSYR